MVTRLLERLGGIGGAVRAGVLVSGGVAASTVAVAAVFVVVGGGGGGAPGTANLFVTASGCTASPTRSSTAVLFGAATAANKACTFDQAYQASNQGDTVLVESGTYPAMTVEDNAGHHSGVCDVGNTAPCTTFKPDPSATVVMTDLTNHAWNTYYDGFNFTRHATAGVDNTGDGGPSITRGTGVVMANMRATQFYIHPETSANPVVNAHIYGGEFGPLYACPGGGQVVGIDGATADWQRPKNVTIEGMYTHDMFVIGACVGNNALDHMDCVHVRETIGYFRYLRNRINNCEDYALLLEGNPDPASVLTISNNMVGPNIAGTDSIQLRGDATSPPVFSGSILITNNSTDGAINNGPNNTINSAVVANNYASSVGACRGAGFTFSHNIMSSGPACGTGDVTGTTFGWVNRATADLHLTAGASAIDVGDPTYCPSVDFDGAPRTGTCDAGAAQR